jgi:NAD-dependent dihydropyrimidine dehydrogenase PreA subunit
MVMTARAEHPTVQKFYSSHPENAAAAPPLEADWLRRLCLDAGADDVGFVGIERAEVAEQRSDILAALPGTRTLISFVCRMNREPIRSPARSVSNLEFHHTGEHVNEVSRTIVTALERKGIRAINPSMGFPMEMDRFPGKIWVVSHKPIAVAAGLGQMGIHRNVIHPRFGNFILLGTILVAAEASQQHAPISFNPCLSCKHCVAACPDGAKHGDGGFDFAACHTHNYKEFSGGFVNWVAEIADSKNASDYRRRVSDAESASMWQSLSFGANYKAAYCLAVCPAGEDVIGPFLTDHKGFLDSVVKPLQEKQEPIYVVSGSDAEEHVMRRFPHKRVRPVRTPFRPLSIAALFRLGMRLAFQRGPARDLQATYHFTFTGAESGQWTVIINNQTIQVKPDLVGERDIHVEADSQTWLGIVTRERSVLWALLRRKVRVRGPLELLRAFARCFPG